MTKSDNIEIEEASRARPILGQVLFYFGICLAGGGVAAGLSLSLERGLDTVIAAVSGTFIALGLLLLFIASKVGNFEPVNLRTRAGRSQLILLVFALIGVLAGAYFTVDDRAMRMLDGSLALTPLEGSIALALLFGLILPINLYWAMTIDEHENAAAQFAGYWTLYIYMFAYMGWVIASLAGFMPPVDDGLMFLIVVFSFTIIWMVKRAG